MDFSPAALISRAIVFLVAIAVHEFAHAYVAHLMGDNTAKEQGRMTLNPAANINLTGYFIGVFLGFAILGSAPVNPYRMRNRRLGMLLAVSAGPISNLILAILFAIPFRLFPSLLFGVYDSSPLGQMIPTAEHILFDMVQLNLVLFVFNLLPLYPLDGWTVMLAAFPPEWAIWWQRNQQNSMYVLFGLFALSFLGARMPALNVLGWLISTPVISIMQLLFGP
ncbi:MAG: site-2 protease family protein [Anaerolineae bacterium]|nr:site-2 protease family protein [Anaerolineae bacterium]